MKKLLFLIMFLAGCVTVQAHNFPVIGAPYGMVWLHEMAGLKTIYNNSTQGGVLTVQSQVNNFEEAILDGIDGITLDVFTTPSIIENSLTAADNLTTSSGKQFMIAPEFDLSSYYQNNGIPSQMIAAETQAIQSYCSTVAPGHPSAAKAENGKYIIFFYGTNQLTPAQQQQALSAAASTCSFYTVGTVAASGISTMTLASQFPTAQAQSYIGVNDASYDFVPVVTPPTGAGQVMNTPILSQIESIYQNGNEPLFGSAMPQYTRTGQPILWPPDGGARLQVEFNDILAKKSPAVIIMTMNDTGDGSAIFSSWDSPNQVWTPSYEAQVKAFTTKYHSII